MAMTETRLTDPSQGFMSGVALAVAFVLALQPITRATAADDTKVKRGEYLARAGDCISCHTAPGGRPFAGGLHMPTPFGDISTPNITPDKATGIGDWSDEEFYRAMHEGVGRGNEYLYPVFPFPWFTKISREDVLAIKAYLFSLPPEHAPRSQLKLAFPFNIRESLLAWRTAFFKPGNFVPDPRHSDAVNRGAYLVEGLGHCGECHNHDNIFGASNWSGRLKGGQIEGWYAPNITADGRNGISAWSEAELVTFLKNGVAPGKELALGPMRETIDASLRYLSDDDLHAIVLYLKSATGQPMPTPAAELAATPAPSAGARVYLSSCAYCHLPDGRGIAGIIPPLVANGAVNAQGPENVIRVVLGGLEAQHGLGPMPAVGATMSDSEVADVVNYVRTVWNNDAHANAEEGMVADLRTRTRTLLAGNRDGGCPVIANSNLAKVIDETAVRDDLKGLVLPGMLEHIDAILAKVKGTAAADDDIVNALTAAYCPLVLADTALPPAERASLLGNFAELVYGQIRKGEKPN
jgi:mono/diheme cytochrome c family protein